MFNHPASGLNLTLYRAYDPIAGRWLSRDPLGEPSDPYANLYAYVGGNTPNLIDPLGLVPTPGPGAPNAPSGDGLCSDDDAGSMDFAVNPHRFLRDSDCLLAGPGGCGGPTGGGGGSRVGKGKPSQPPPNAVQQAPLQRLHPDSTITSGNKSSYDYWSKQSTERITDSLKPGSQSGPLTVKKDGVIMNGNTRVLILQERGIDVNSLPRVPYP